MNKYQNAKVHTEGPFDGKVFQCVGINKNEIEVLNGKESVTGEFFNGLGTGVYIVDTDMHNNFPSFISKEESNRGGRDRIIQKFQSMYRSKIEINDDSPIYAVYAVIGKDTKIPIKVLMGMGDPKRGHQGDISSFLLRVYVETGSYIKIGIKQKDVEPSGIPQQDKKKLENLVSKAMGITPEDVKAEELAKYVVQLIGGDNIIQGLKKYKYEKGLKMFGYDLKYDPNYCNEE